MSTPRTAFDEALENSAKELEEVAQETLKDPAVQEALADDTVDDAW